MKVLTSIRKLLVTCSLALAMVSFYATAQGLHEYVFTQMWQALLVSAAIQTALFILNLKLIYFFTLNPRFVLILWATMLISSSLFSFVFISNEIYNTSLYYSDAERIMDEFTIKKCYQYQNYLDNYLIYTKETMDAYCSVPFVSHSSESNTEITKILDDCKTDISSFTFSSNCAAFHRSLLKNLDSIKSSLPSSYTEQQANDALTALEGEKNNAKTLKNNMLSNIRSKEAVWNNINLRLSQYRNFNDQAFIDLQNNNNKRDTEINSMKAEATQLDSVISALQTCINKVTAHKMNNTENTMESYRHDLMVEINKDAPDGDILDTITSDMFALLLKEGFTSSSYEMTNYFSFKNSLSVRKEILECQDKTDAIIHMLDNKRQDKNAFMFTSKADENTEKQIESWKQLWYGQTNELRELVKSLPLPQDLIIYSSDAENGTVTLNPGINLPEPDRTDEIDDISALERRYLANLNPLEKALNLLHTKYNTMALFSAAAAAVLDISSALMGAFVYTLERAFKNRKTAPATPAVLASTE